MSDPREEARRREAEETLRRIEQDRPLGDRRPAAPEVTDGDPAVLWGRRVGRLVAILFTAYMVYVLVGLVLGHAS